MESSTRNTIRTPNEKENQSAKLCIHLEITLIPPSLVVSKSGNLGPGPVPKTWAQIRIFFITSLIIKALILIKLLKLVMDIL
jgi:hypothetical protein